MVVNCNPSILQYVHSAYIIVDAPHDQRHQAFRQKALSTNNRARVSQTTHTLRCRWSVLLSSQGEERAPDEGPGGWLTGDQEEKGN